MAPSSSESIREGSDAYYDAATAIVESSKSFFVAAKTPSLLLPAERGSPGRERYFQTASKKIKSDKLETIYLFSEPQTRLELEKLTPDQREPTRSEWLAFAKLSNFTLGSLPDSGFQSFVLGDSTAAVALKDPVTGKSNGAKILTGLGVASCRKAARILNQRATWMDEKSIRAFFDSL